MGGDYDSEADVRYISFGALRPAVGVDMGNDIGERIIARAGHLLGD